MTAAGLSLFFLPGWAPAMLLLFGAVDLLGAVWTFLALRADAQRPEGSA